MISRLMREHADLRRRAAEIEEALGPGVGVGWSDCACCDLAKLRAAQESLSKELLEHEDEESHLLTDSLMKVGADPLEYGRELEKSHRTLARLVGLMRTVTTLCDGNHVYAVRTAVRRVREELEAHLEHEEKVLFPLLDRAVKRR